MQTGAAEINRTSVCDDSDQTRVSQSSVQTCLVDVSTDKTSNCGPPQHLHIFLCFLKLFEVSNRLLHSYLLAVGATKPHDFFCCFDSTKERAEASPPPRCLYSSRLSCLLPASVAAPIMIPLCIMTKRFFFYDLLLAGSLQHHLFLSPHEKISAVFCYCFFSCSSFFYTL